MCTVTINEAIGIGPDPEFIRVEGTVVDCASDIEGDRVIVSVACEENADPFATGSADVNGDTWVILFPVPADSECGCGEPVFVTARCATDDSCVAEPFSVAELRCPDCPTVRGIAPEPGDELFECNPDLTASVTVEALVDNVTANDVRAFIECGTNPQGDLEAPDNFIELEPGEIGAVTATCNYATPSTPAPFVRFTDLSGNDIGCPEVPIPVSDVDCPCPEVVDLTATVEGCEVTFEGTLSLDSVNCDYIWDFDDGSDDVKTAGPNATHTYPCADTYAAVVTAKCGEKCSETTTVIVTTEEGEGCPPCRGACCLPNGGCEELTEAECRNRGGDYQGNRTECAKIDCGDDGNDDDSDDCVWCLWGCWALLMLGIASVFAAVALFIVAGCLQNFSDPLVWGTAVALAVSGLVALGTWALLCKNFVNCTTLCTLITIVKAAIVVQAVLAVALAILAGLGVVSSWLCAVAIGAGGFYLGLVLVVLLWANQRFNCGCENTGE